jgi:hypothetical protein
MHKFITEFFSTILTFVHTVTFATLAYLLYVGSDISIAPDASPAMNFMIVVGLAVGYTLFAGITSVIIRINQNLEVIAERLSDWQDDEAELEEDSELES